MSDPRLAELRRLVPAPIAGAMLSLAAMLFPLAAAGQDDAARASLRYGAAALVQVNPGVVASDLRVAWRFRLYDSSAPALRDNGVGAFASLGTGLRGLRPTVGVAVQPASFLALGAEYGATFYFGNGLAQSYPSPRWDYAGGAISGPSDGPGGSYALTVRQLRLSAALQAKFGPMLVRSASQATRLVANPHGSDTVVYDPGADVVVFARGWVAENDTDIAAQLAPTLILGVRHSLTLAWYPGSAYAQGEPHDDPGTPISRVGPVVAWTVFERRGARIDTATLAVLAQWYLAHRYRTGEAVSQAFPLVGAAFTLSGDLLRSSTARAR